MSFPDRILHKIAEAEQAAELPRQAKRIGNWLRLISFQIACITIMLLVHFVKQDFK